MVESKLSDVIDGVVGPVMRKRGVVEAQLFESWDRVLGKEWGGYLLHLQRVVFPKGKNNHGVLYMRSDHVTANLLQHESARFIERVNQLLGYGAISELRFEPLRAEDMAEDVEVKNSSKDIKKDFAQAVDPSIIQHEREMIERIDDDNLREILEGMLTQLSKK